MACRNCASECLCAVIGTGGANVTGDGSGPNPYTVTVLRDPVAGNLVTVSVAGVLVSTESVQDAVGPMVPSPLTYNDGLNVWQWTGGTDGQVLTKSGSGAVWSSIGSGGSTAMSTAASTTTMTTSGVTDPTSGFAGGSSGSLTFLSETFTLRAGCGMEVQLDATAALYSIRPAVFTFASTGYSAGSCVSTSGAPIFCDSAGRLRSVPDHRSAAARTTGADGSIVSFSALAGVGASASVTVNNPSVCRAFSLFASMETFFRWDQAATQMLFHQHQILAGFFTGTFVKHATVPYQAANTEFQQSATTMQAGSVAAGGSQGLNHQLRWDAGGIYVGGNHLSSNAVIAYIGVTT